jgi:hypothetical protein
MNRVPSSVHDAGLRTIAMPRLRAIRAAEGVAGRRAAGAAVDLNALKWPEIQGFPVGTASNRAAFITQKFDRMV